MSSNYNNLYQELDEIQRLIHKYQILEFKGHNPKTDITPAQERILDVLKESDSIRAKELAEKLGIRQQSLNEQLKKLERKGFIYRSPSKKDKRIITIHLTKKVEEIGDQMKDYKALFNGIDKEDLIRLEDELSIIIDNLREITGKEPMPPHLRGPEGEPLPPHLRGPKGEPLPPHERGPKGEPLPPHLRGPESEPLPPHLRGPEDEPLPPHERGPKEGPRPEEPRRPGEPKPKPEKGLELSPEELDRLIDRLADRITERIINEDNKIAGPDVPKPEPVKPSVLEKEPKPEDPDEFLEVKDPDGPAWDRPEPAMHNEVLEPESNEE